MEIVHLLPHQYADNFITGVWHWQILCEMTHFKVNRFSLVVKCTGLQIVSFTNFLEENLRCKPLFTLSKPTSIHLLTKVPHVWWGREMLAYPRKVLFRGKKLPCKSMMYWTMNLKGKWVWKLFASFSKKHPWTKNCPVSLHLLDLFRYSMRWHDVCTL